MDWEGKRCSNTAQVFQTCVSGGLLVFKHNSSVPDLCFRRLACVQTEFECFKMVRRACAHCQCCWLKEVSVSCLQSTHLHLLAVFEPGQEEQPLSKCVLPNSLLRCVPITNRADKKINPQKSEFWHLCASGVLCVKKHKAQGWEWPKQCEVRALANLGLSEP